jgi:hypothetical protein
MPEFSFAQKILRIFRRATDDAPLPDFLGIGAQKCGTTWVHYQFATHPQIFVPETKELDFFFWRKKPIEWYHAQFAGAKRGQKKGELSPNYALRDDTPGVIHALLPSVKLFYIVRQPVERAFSQWKMARRLGNVPAELPFIEVFRQNLQFMQERGKYEECVRRYARVFRLGETFRVFFYDDLCADPQAFLRELFRFVGVDAEWQPPKLRDRVGANAESREMSSEDEREALDFYLPHIEALERELGRALPDWKLPRAR